jgi:hypothetical protein
MDLVLPLTSQSFANPKFMGSQNSPDALPPDAMIKDFRALLDATQDTMHLIIICSSTEEFIQA